MYLAIDMTDGLLQTIEYLEEAFYVVSNLKQFEKAPVLLA